MGGIQLGEREGMKKEENQDGSLTVADASRQEDPSGPKWTCVGCGNTDPAKYRTIRCGSPMDPPDYDIECDECGSNEFEESPILALRRVIDQRDQLYGDLSQAREALEARPALVGHGQGVCSHRRFPLPATPGDCSWCGKRLHTVVEEDGIATAEEAFPVMLRRARKALGLTQEDLGAKIGILKAAVANYENGHRSPSISLLRALSEALGVSTDYLIGRSALEAKPARSAEQGNTHAT